MTMAMHPTVFCFINDEQKLRTVHNRTLKCLNKLCEMGRSHEAIDLMEHLAIPLSRSNAYHLLQECTRNEDADCARRVQSLMAKYNLDCVAVLGDHLIRLLNASGSLSEANEVFKRVLYPSVYTWSSILWAHVNLGEAAMAIELYCMMQRSGRNSDKYVLIAMVKACTRALSLEHGRSIHQEIVAAALQSDIVLGSSLIDMYVQNGSLNEAQKVFDKLGQRDVVCWNAMAAGFAQHGKGLVILEFLNSMQREGVKPDRVTFLSILRACSRVGAIDQGRLVHKEIIKYGLEFDGAIGNTIVDMYAKCGNLHDARKIFDKLRHRSIVSWGAMIAGYAQHGEGLLAFDCFKKMKKEGITANKVIYLGILKACAGIQDIDHGRILHSEIIRSGLESDITVENALIDMYAKCGSLKAACAVFNRMSSWDVVSWGAMITAYTQHGKGQLALECFGNMQQDGVEPNKVTFLSALKACGNVGAIDQGRLIHNQIQRNDLHSDAVLASTLVDMYAKCGCLKDARELFDKLPCRILASWNAMIAGYAQHGEFFLAEQCLESMEQQGLKPDEVTFVIMVTACSRVGRLDKGQWYFGYMSELHGIRSGNIHYNCVVDLLSRAGCFQEAEKLLQSTTQLDSSGWMSLVNANRTCGDLCPGGL